MILACSSLVRRRAALVNLDRWRLTWRALARNWSEAARQPCDLALECGDLLFECGANALGWCAPLAIRNPPSVRVRVSLRRIRKFVVHQRELGRGLLTALVECCDALVKFGNIRRSLTGAKPIVAVFLEFLQ